MKDSKAFTSAEHPHDSSLSLRILVRKKQFRFVGFLARKRKNTVRVENTVRVISVCLYPAGGPVRRFIPDVDGFGWSVGQAKNSCSHSKLILSCSLPNVTPLIDFTQF